MDCNSVCQELEDEVVSLTAETDNKVVALKADHRKLAEDRRQYRTKNPLPPRSSPNDPAILAGL